MIFNNKMGHVGSVYVTILRGMEGDYTSMDMYTIINVGGPRKIIRIQHSLFGDKLLETKL